MSRSLDIKKWRSRLLEAWESKVNVDGPPNESTTRMQGDYRVTLLLWDDKHVWYVVAVERKLVKGWARVGVDRPMSQEEVFCWLGKTKPIE